MLFQMISIAKICPCKTIPNMILFLHNLWCTIYRQRCDFTMYISAFSSCWLSVDILLMHSEISYPFVVSVFPGSRQGGPWTCLLLFRLLLYLIHNMKSLDPYRVRGGCSQQWDDRKAVKTMKSLYFAFSLCPMYFPQRTTSSVLSLNQFFNKWNRYYLEEAFLMHRVTFTLIIYLLNDK